MKVAPILRALQENGHEALLVHTGQHYSPDMSDSFFRDLQLPEPDFHLGVGSGSHAEQTARVMLAFEPVLEETRPDWVVVVGDVNSTLACALVTAKLKERIGCRLAHVEAGLRSRDWRMPEEVNRVLTDRVSDLLLTPSRDARANLLAEGLADDAIAFVGNVMVDTLLRQLDVARGLDLPARFGLPRRGYAVATVHRPGNVDDPHALRVILEAFSLVAGKMPLVLPIHPRTRKSVENFGLHSLLSPLLVCEPLGYTEMLSLMDGASVVLTDSGGLQEETTALGIPCITLREQTERPVTLEEGTNRLAPWPLTSEGVFATVQAVLEEFSEVTATTVPDGWDGQAAARAVAFMEDRMGEELAEVLSGSESTRLASGASFHP